MDLGGILKATSGVCGILSACGVPGAGLVGACASFLGGMAVDG